MNQSKHAPTSPGSSSNSSSAGAAATAATAEVPQHTPVRNFNGSQVKAYLNQEYEMLVKKAAGSGSSSSSQGSGERPVVIYSASETGWSSASTRHGTASGKTSKGQNFVMEIRRGLETRS